MHTNILLIGNIILRKKRACFVYGVISGVQHIAYESNNSDITITYLIENHLFGKE